MKSTLHYCTSRLPPWTWDVESSLHVLQSLSSTASPNSNTQLTSTWRLPAVRCLTLEALCQHLFATALTVSINKTHSLPMCLWWTNTHTHRSNSPRGSPQFPARWQQLPFVKGHDPHGCLHDRDELLKLHLLILLGHRQHHTHHAAGCRYTSIAHLLTKLKTTSGFSISMFAHPPPQHHIGNLSSLGASVYQRLHMSHSWSAQRGEVPVVRLLRLLSHTANSEMSFLLFWAREDKRGKQMGTFLPGGGPAERGWHHVTLT